ncbi:hypothetical protein BDF20DRAFT_821688 [Mycotypha africana]|uniref:uncharacterized protein n=1 Tax=Mycotypha africana TaxID=64632 RepID=UPI0022FFC503|nr:uncharacterized protein BDF20DRAFT_821688 [Mycotypha africana]KAI8977537.1 hypothetical protein BDF20DRAFT_821688 [Mycotypha africana]
MNRVSHGFPFFLFCFFFFLCCSYFAKIIEKLPKPVNTSVTTEHDVPRQPNGRLRFPDAFLLPTPISPVVTERKNILNKEKKSVNEYRIQLINDLGQPLENCTRIIEEQQIKRDSNVFTRSTIQNYIRECCYRDNYANAPWLIKPSVADKYSIDATLPLHLQELQEQVMTNVSRKRKPLTIIEKEAEKRARKEETLLQKAKLKEERIRLREEKKKQSAVKYPVEDLDLPIYRKDPNTNWTLVDMNPEHYNASNTHIPYPSGGRTERPIPQHASRIPPGLFEIFLSVWTFISIFSEPLKITAYSLDDFEQALLHNTHQPKATVLVEYNACLLNVIIKERKEGTTNELINGTLMEDYVDALTEELEDNEERKKNNKEEDHNPLPRIERGWRDKDHLKFSQRWDHKELRANYDRRGWETALIGCLNDVATPDILPNVDELLQHLVPKSGSSAADREKQYPTLGIKEKLDILHFLIDTVNESTLIKNYMEYCQEQMTEFRKQKMELNKEARILNAKRIELKKQERSKKDEENGTTEDGDDDDDEDDEEDDDDLTSSEHSDSDSSDEDESDEENDTTKQLERRHLSRQEKLKQKQRERVEEELKRKKEYAEQRMIAKAKNEEQRLKANERRKLEENEKTVKRKEEHLERSMRKYNTLRVRPLGKDRFYNRYYYLDNIGIANTYGSGRLFVNSPSDGDIQLLMERDHYTNLPERPWGYGGGVWFVKKLMQEQGLVDESEWLEQRMNELKTDQPPAYYGWWRYYSETEEIEKLLSWLNPKGIREHKLKSEIVKKRSLIEESMKKRSQVWKLNKTSPIVPLENRIWYLR